MSKSPLAAMLPFRARRWFDKEFTRLAQLIADTFTSRSEILGGGGNLAPGTVGVSTLNLSYDAMQVMLGGLLMEDVALIADVDVLAAAGSIGAAIYSDGSLVSGDLPVMAGGETIPVTLVVTNSDGSGGAAGDDGAPLLVAILPGTDAASAKAATETPSSVDVAAALAGSSTLHEGTTAWAHYAHVLWEGTGPAAVPTLNRNNAVLGL